MKAVRAFLERNAQRGQAVQGQDGPVYLLRAETWVKLALLEDKGSWVYQGARRLRAGASLEDCPLAWTPLILAIARGDAVSVVQLAEECEQEGGGDNLGRALVFSAAVGDIACLKVLLSAGADVGAAQGGWWGGGWVVQTALHCGAGNGHEECVSELVQQGASIDAATAKGDRPLHCAAGNGHVGCVRGLIEGGADCGIARQDGDTPLHCAAAGGAGGALDVARELLKGGASGDCKNKAGVTPLDVARASGNIQMEALLRDGVFVPVVSS